MSRGLDDERSDRSAGDLGRTADHRDNPDDAFLRPLPSLRGAQRDLVPHRDRQYRINESEARMLATVGAFRVVSVNDFGGGEGRSLRHLEGEGLIKTESLADRHGVERVASLTRDGKGLLDAHASRDVHGHRQEYYAGVVKPRELRHDIQVYRAFTEEARRIENAGGRVTRVILDYELKRDYQSFLNRPGHGHEGEQADLDRDRKAFADANGLPVVRGHLALPDVRIEYETEAGGLEHRDVEVVTEHYSRGQVGGKAKAGFACYRAAGSSRNASGRKGGTPFDPRHLERLS